MTHEFSRLSGVTLIFRRGHRFCCILIAVLTRGLGSIQLTHRSARALRSRTSRWPHLNEGWKGKEIEHAGPIIHESEGFVLIRLQMHLTSGVPVEIVEAEEKRCVRSQETQTLLLVAIDGGCIRLEYDKGNSVDTANGNRVACDKGDKVLNDN